MILLALALKMPLVLTPFLLLLHGILFWDEDDVQDMVDDVPVAPNIWTDGSREPIPHLDVDVAGTGAFVHSPSFIFDNHHWVMLKILMIRMKAALTSFRVFLALFSGCFTLS